MHHNLLSVLGLLFGVLLLVMLAQRIRIAYPIFLVIAGLAIGLIPGTPVFKLDPDLIFLIFLPPLLYEAAWYTAWKEFWKWKRPIALLAFGLVFFTSSVVAYASSSIIPGFTLALGFLLGGIISPPDAVAAATVLKNIKVPKRILTILEGESLVNDASSLIVFRFALAAILTGSFSIEEASGSFFVVTFMGIVIGLAGAHVMYAIHRFLPTTASIDAALTVMTPYLLFLAAEHFHFSGVMAVVSGGLFISWRSHEIFQNGVTRLNMLGVWNTMIFVMNALVFILIGLSLPDIVNNMGSYSISDGIIYGLIFSGIAIGLRFIWVFPATHLPRMLSATMRQERNPGWKGPLIVSWAGMRGVVSLATALSIPILMTDGSTFPFRNLIIFITFVVIFVTIVLQGLTLPLLIKWIDLSEIDDSKPEDEQITGIHLHINKAALRHLDQHYVYEIRSNGLIGTLKKDLERNIHTLSNRLESLECNELEKNQFESYRKVLSDIYKIQRLELFALRKNNLFADEHIRRAEMQIDLDETKISGHGLH